MLDQYDSVLCVAYASSMRLATIEPGEAGTSMVMCECRSSWPLAAEGLEPVSADIRTRLCSWAVIPLGKDAMGRAARTMAPSSLQRINGAPHATAERFE
jgi:hypothetical protein